MEKFAKEILCKRGSFNSRYAPVLHLLIPVVSDREVLVEAVVRGVAGRVVDDGRVSAERKNRRLNPNPNELEKICASC